MFKIIPPKYVMFKESPQKCEFLQCILDISYNS
jgi:hypothetical protein